MGRPIPRDVLIEKVSRYPYRVTDRDVGDLVQNVINRVADGFGFDMSSEGKFERGAKHLLEHGYARRGE